MFEKGEKYVIAPRQRDDERLDGYLGYMVTSSGCHAPLPA